MYLCGEVDASAGRVQAAERVAGGVQPNGLLRAHSPKHGWRELGGEESRAGEVVAVGALFRGLVPAKVRGKAR
jgi:hypothetical protein